MPVSKRQVHCNHDLHQKYGPYARVGPGEVLVADIPAHKIIHKVGSGFNKADYYHYFGANEAGKPLYDLFQMTNPSDHAARRKLLGRGFTVSSMGNDWEQLVHNKAETAVVGIQNDARAANGEVDVLKW